MIVTGPPSRVSMSSSTITLVDPLQFRSFCFRGEGRANFVISAKCDRTGNRIVWRVAKHRKTGNVAVKPKQELVLLYMEQLVVPLLDRHFLLRPSVVRLSTEHMHHLAKIPSLQANAKVEHFDELRDLDKFPVELSFLPTRLVPRGVDSVSALEMPDATSIPNRGMFHGLTITVEIKPKQGFAQIHPGVDLPFCNNCILQLEKCRSAAFDRMYDFCPLDLFSGDLERMRGALQSLFRVPHRNLRLFLGGTLIHSDESTLELAQLSASLFPDQIITIDQLVTALCYILAGVSSEDEQFSLKTNSVLGKLLAAQRVDTIGIVRAYQLYNSLPHDIQKQLKNKALLPAKGLSFLERRDARALLERYFLAATMKDCSIMLSVRMLLAPDEACPLPVLRVPGSSQDLYMAYSIHVVDLDPKTPKNLISAYHRFMDGVKILRHNTDIHRPCRI